MGAGGRRELWVTLDESLFDYFADGCLAIQARVPPLQDNVRA